MFATPALLTSTAMRGYFARISSASLRIDSWDARSASRRSTVAPGTAARMRAAEVSPRSRFRATIASFAPARARPIAISSPIPEVAPVTMPTSPRTLHSPAIGSSSRARW